MRDDPERGAALLHELGVEAEEALEEIRSLAQGVYPAVLVDHGLGPALDALARRMPVQTTVDAAGLGRYRSELESAVYFCCVEALQNVVKHVPNAKNVTITAEAGHALRFEVADDGDGFPERRAGAGTGFTNMRDRLAVVGGELEVHSRVGVGTRVTGTVPLR